MNRCVLKLKGIKKSYNRGLPSEVKVLRDVDLTLTSGEMVALVAPSGAGKSTLLHIAGLLDKPDAGAIEIGGEVLSDQNDRKRTAVRRNDVGFVYQFHHLLPEFNAIENIILPQLANGVAKSVAEEKAAELLSRVGVSNRSLHRPAALSGGEQQRVAFCRALANNPLILLADEPTGNLDPSMSDQIFDTLVELVRGTGLAALIATHNMALASRMDRKVRLEDGELVNG